MHELFLAFDIEGTGMLHVEQLEKLLFGVALSEDERAAHHRLAAVRQAQWKQEEYRGWLRYLSDALRTFITWAAPPR